MERSKNISNTNCCVFGCHSKKSRNPDLGFHHFPATNASFVFVQNAHGVTEKVDRCKAWTHNLKMRKLPSRSMFVCSSHFTKDDYILPDYTVKKKRLKATAVPSQNLPKTSLTTTASNTQQLESKIEYKKSKLQSLSHSNPPAPVCTSVKPKGDSQGHKGADEQGDEMSRRMETRTHPKRAASKVALKQMALITALDDDDSTETYEITSDEDVVAVEAPPKKKYKLSHRKSSDGNDRDVLVLKTITTVNDDTLNLEAWPEELSPAQLAMHKKIESELNEMNSKIEQMIKQTSAEMIYQGEVCNAFQIGGPPGLSFSGVSGQSNVVLQPAKTNNTQTTNYQLVMDPRLGLIVGTMTPANNSISTTLTTQKKAPTPAPASKTPATPPITRQTRTRGRTARTTTQTQVTTVTSPAVAAKTTRVQQKTAPAVTTPPVVNLRPTESSAVGGLSTGTTQKTIANNSVVDLTSDDGRPPADSREISFNKLQGKTFPSLVVVARPHLCVKDSAGNDRSKLDSKVKAVLMHQPTKFTEWLIQQGLVRSEQNCSIHSSSKLKLGMYSDVSKFPYSGGYVWISECCPQRFVSVFSGSLFEGSPHPPSVILKLIYHWACQTNVQNVVQWVKVDNLYVKGLNTWLRAACTVALHTHIAPLGGPGRKVEVGVISLGTTSQDGHQRQVKVEVLGLLETENKRLRLRAVEPLADGDRNYRKRFSKILEPIVRWVHPESIIVTDLTVDKATLHSMGFKNVQQSTSNDAGSGNQTIMEYLRRIVPRMFQNTLSLLSRQIIQQFLDELVWREWYGTTAVLAFDNMVMHLSEQTRCDAGQSLIVRLNKVAANPFKSWSIAHSLQTSSGAVKTSEPEQTPKRYTARQQRTKVVTFQKTTTPPPETRPMKAISPDIPEQMVPLENYYYGTIQGRNLSMTNSTVVLNLKCSVCKMHFNNNVKLMTHLFSHAHSVAAGAQQCRYCLASVATSDGLQNHIQSSHPYETRFGDAYACVICESRYQNPYSLGKHMSKEHNPSELPYVCSSCGFRCSSHKQAVDHFYTEHDGSGQLQCPFCLKSTSVCSNNRMQPQNLGYFLQHLQKHQKKALAKKCPTCALWFVQKEVLREHQIKNHASQRNKEGLVPWSAPRNGIMVPKSKQDRQPVEEEDINYAKLIISAPMTLVCKECKLPLTKAGHFPSSQCCTNNNCQYSTCCAAALKNHSAICKSLNDSLPVHTLPCEMFCVCGYSDTDGNTLAKHLAICERKSAYPSAAVAKAAIVNHSMLDVLGLVRRLEEPPSTSESKEKVEDAEKKSDTPMEVAEEKSKEVEEEKSKDVEEEKSKDVEEEKSEDVEEEKSEDIEGENSEGEKSKEVEDKEDDGDKVSEVEEKEAEKSGEDEAMEVDGGGEASAEIPESEENEGMEVDNEEEKENDDSPADNSPADNSPVPEEAEEIEEHAVEEEPKEDDPEADSLVESTEPETIVEEDSEEVNTEENEAESVPNPQNDEQLFDDSVFGDSLLENGPSVGRPAETSADDIETIEKIMEAVESANEVSSSIQDILNE